MNQRAQNRNLKNHTETHNKASHLGACGLIVKSQHQERQAFQRSNIVGGTEACPLLSRII